MRDDDQPRIDGAFIESPSSIRHSHPELEAAIRDLAESNRELASAIRGTRDAAEEEARHSNEFYRDKCGITRIDRLVGGRFACCLCFEFFYPEGLNQIAPFLDGSREDVCHSCAEIELEIGRQRAGRP